MPLITLLTDFGSRDGYVGAMKGVIASLAPGVQVVDVSHDVTPQDIAHAGFVWTTSTPYFPSGTVHVAVVDPGVGSSRRILAAELGGSSFLCPDNGLLGYVLQYRRGWRVREVRSPRLYLRPVSRTFHGRDIFAPVASRLALGMAFEEVGPVVGDFKRLGFPRARTQRAGPSLVISGRVLHVDRFGNAVTSLRSPPRADFVRLEAGGHVVKCLCTSYAAVRPGSPLAIEGSSGYLEIAVCCGSASDTLSVEEGTPVRSWWRLRSPRPGRGRRGPR